MEKKILFIAKDGKEFEDKEKCLEYEKGNEREVTDDDKDTLVELSDGKAINGKEIIEYFKIYNNGDKCANCPFAYECGYMMGKLAIGGSNNVFTLCDAVIGKIK